MSRRVRVEILGREVVDANKDTLAEPKMLRALGALAALDAELEDAASTKIRHLTDEWAPDAGEWRAILDPVVTAGETWLSAPWCTTEFYLYRRVMEALNFYPVSASSSELPFFDPFLASKRRGLASALPSMEALAPKVLAVLETASSLRAEALATQLRLFTLISLWGNRMDLSLWPAGSAGNVADAFASVLAAGESNLLADDLVDLDKAVASAQASGGGEVHVIVDNAGFELVTDLLLADFLVASGAASKVVFQLKSHPTFVSDARATDLEEHVRTLRGLDPAGLHPGCQRLGERWAGHLASGCFELREHSFWVQPSPTWELPADLRLELKGAALVFTKGDANYRRLLGDRSWALDAPFQAVVSYFPTTVCALRTLKAELGCGMVREETDRAAASDPQWMVNGKFGVIQVAPPAKE